MHLTTIYIGIDPGKSGGIVWGDNPRRPIGVEKMPDSVHDLGVMINNIVAAYPKHPIEAHLERITGYLSGIKASPKTAFTFGRNVGHLEMILAACEIPLTEVTPANWMKKCGIATGRKKLLGATKWKNLLKAEAQKRYPHLAAEITLAKADALLIYHSAFLA